jgi:hypothetical protein
LQSPVTSIGKALAIHTPSALSAILRFLACRGGG